MIDSESVIKNRAAMGRRGNMFQRVQTKEEHFWFEQLWEIFVKKET